MVDVASNDLRDRGHVTVATRSENQLQNLLRIAHVVDYARRGKVHVCPRPIAKVNDGAEEARPSGGTVDEPMEVLI
jgi:hypothetical protein